MRALGLILALAATTACGQDLAQQAERISLDVTRAFARHSFDLAPDTLEKRLAPSGSQLFPNFGFVPRVMTGLLWQLYALNDDESLLCLSVEAPSAQAWNEAVVGLSTSGLSAANPSDCSPLQRYSPAPSVFPAIVAGVKVLDRRDVPSSTVLPTHPVISGVDDTAVTRPGLTLARGAAATNILVHNSLLLDAEGVPIALGLEAVTTRPGFSVVHNCASVSAGGSCVVSVQYVGQEPQGLTGQLLLSFSTGARANIGLQGVR